MVLEQPLSPYKIERYPQSNSTSLQSWNAADEYLLLHLYQEQIPFSSAVIYNDRFGFLTCALQNFKPITIIDSKSQEKSIYKNIENNQLNLSSFVFLSPLDKFPQPISLVLIKIPKSVDLFQLYLQQILPYLKEESRVICGFMTKYFNPQIISIANLFFENVEQSKAWKKSRLLLLSKPKKNTPQNILNKIQLNENKIINQYFGVFSAKHIDYASQFLIEHLTVPPKAQEVLDLASGNGILAYAIRQQNVDCRLHLIDDFYLAVASSKLNLSGDNIFFHFNNSLEEFPANFFDFVISNPPFHFEHEVSIETTLNLFKEVYYCLKTNGNFLLVANKHLNYKTHLQPLFQKVENIAENEKFIIYNCIKK